LLRWAKNGNSAALIPDGPKGPRERVKEGLPALVKLAQVPVVAIGVSYGNRITLSTWDRFEVPLPHSKCSVYFATPLYPEEVRDADSLTRKLKLANLAAEKMLRYEG